MSSSEPTLPTFGVVHPKISERLFDSRTILIHGEVNSKLAQDVSAQLLAMAGESDEAT